MSISARRSCWTAFICVLLAMPACNRQAVEETSSTATAAEQVTDDAGENASENATSREVASGTSLNNQPAEQLAKPEAVDAEVFRMAAYEGQIAVVRHALESGTPVDEADPQQRLTALHMAAYNGHTGIVKLLLENKASVDPQDHEGKTPLLHACTGPFPETVALLLKFGADVNARETTEGFTPLMMAAGLGQVETVKLLLQNDADRSLRDNDGDRAVDHARNSRNGEIVAILGP